MNREGESQAERSDSPLDVAQFDELGRLEIHDEQLLDAIAAGAAATESPDIAINCGCGSGGNCYSCKRK